MTVSRLIRVGIAAAALWAALPAAADSQFRVRRMTRDDIPLGKGQCDIRLQVDNEAEVTLRRDVVSIHTIAGREARDDGSECNAPLPDREAPGFDFVVTERRNDIVLLAEPSRRNGWATVVRIRDSSGGEGRYIFRVTWQMTGRDDFGRQGREFPQQGRGGLGRGWDSVVHFRGMGQGSSVLSAYGSQRLADATVDIERNGRITVSFRGETERPLALIGQVSDRDGDRWRAEVATEDGRVRGPMYLRIGPRDEVESISFEGGDRFGRLRVNWDRR